jgi:hypothetical protein
VTAEQNESAPTEDSRNAYEVWSREETAELFQQLRDGLTVDQIAKLHRRTENAVTARADHMVPAASLELGVPKRRRDRLNWLREQAEDYDWHTVLSHAKPALSAWSDEQNSRLRQAWNDAEPLPHLCDELLRSEAQIVRQLLVMGLASSQVEVVDRLGCRPGGTLAARYAVAKQLEITELWVLSRRARDHA